MIYAATNGREDNLRFLLARGADLHAKAKNRNEDRRTGQSFGALEAASTCGEPYAQEILLAAGATPANPGAKLTAELFTAIDDKGYERGQAALHKGASPNDPAALNRYPLSLSVLMGDPGIVQLLLKAGADPNGSPETGPLSTPLAYAFSRQKILQDPREVQDCTRIIELLRQAHATR